MSISHWFPSSIFTRRKIPGAALCLLGFIARVSADRDVTICQDGKTLGVINKKGQVVVSGIQGRGQPEGRCRCETGTDKIRYVTCDEGRWARILETPPTNPVLCANAADGNSDPICPAGVSNFFRALSDNYKFEKNTQKVAVCDKGKNLGTLENGYFLRNAEAGNYQYQEEGGCRCGKPTGKPHPILQCTPWPATLETYKGQDVRCYYGLDCPAA